MKQLSSEFAKLMLKPRGFHAWDFPAGQANQSLRREFIGLVFPKLKGKNGIVPVAKAGVTQYRQALESCFDTTDYDAIKESLIRLSQSR